MKAEHFHAKKKISVSGEVFKIQLLQCNLKVYDIKFRDLSSQVSCWLGQVDVWLKDSFLNVGSTSPALWFRAHIVHSAPPHCLIIAKVGRDQEGLVEQQIKIKGLGSC
jgi:hypothetical protein